MSYSSLEVQSDTDNQGCFDITEEPEQSFLHRFLHTTSFRENIWEHSLAIQLHTTGWLPKHNNYKEAPRSLCSHVP